MKNILRITTVALLASGVAACGGDGNSASTPSTTPAVITPAAKQETLFGAGFATSYEQSPTATPTTPVDGDIIPLSLTTEPVTLK